MTEKTQKPEVEKKTAKKAKKETQKGFTPITANMVKNFVIKTKSQMDLSKWRLEHWNPKTRKLKIAVETDLPDKENLQMVLAMFDRDLGDVQETFYQGTWYYQFIF